MLRKLRKIFSRRLSSGGAPLNGRDPALVQLQFDGRLLDQKREDVYALMHQHASSVR